MAWKLIFPKQQGKKVENLHWTISKDLSKGENYRKISIIPYGERYEYIKELEKWLF